MISLIMVVTVLTGALSDSYLLRTADALDRMKEDIPIMVKGADSVAKRIVAGGKLYAGGNPALVSEITGRAGGLMLTTGLPEKINVDTDAIIFFVDSDHLLPSESSAMGACWVVLGVTQPVEGATTLMMRDYGISPTLTMAIQAWMFTGELISACTRLGKMPVLYESIGLYGGILRQQKYQGNNIFWHDTHQVPQISAGLLATEYANLVSAMLRRCEARHRSDFDTVGEWIADAKKTSRTLIMYSMGHLFPDEVGKTAIGSMFRSEVWNAGFSYIPEPKDVYAKGDVVIHIGYQHPPRTMLERAENAGAKAVYVAPYMDRDFPTDENTVWIDPMYPFSDACVPIDGYDIPALASSGVINSAIAWEIYRMSCVHGAMQK